MKSKTFLLVPGAGGNAWFWHRVVDELESRGHTAIAVDLPGDLNTAGLETYVDLVVAAAGEAKKVVIVGQSLGAFTAVVACARLPVKALVLVNAMIPAPGETAGQWWENTGASRARAAMDAAAGRDPDAEVDAFTYFLHDLSPEDIAESEAQVREETDRAFETPAAFEAWPDVPTRVIVGRDDRLFPSEFQRRLARERVGVEAHEIPGGHLAALSHPVELVDELEAALS